MCGPVCLPVRMCMQILFTTFFFFLRISGRDEREMSGARHLTRLDRKGRRKASSVVERLEHGTCVSYVAKIVELSLSPKERNSQLESDDHPLWSDVSQADLPKADEKATWNFATWDVQELHLIAQTYRRRHSSYFPEGKETGFLLLPALLRAMATSNNFVNGKLQRRRGWVTLTSQHWSFFIGLGIEA